MGRRELARSVGLKAVWGSWLISSGVAPGSHSVETLLDSLYDANPEALINGEVRDEELR